MIVDALAAAHTQYERERAAAAPAGTAPGATAVLFVVQAREKERLRTPSRAVPPLSDASTRPRPSFAQPKERNVIDQRLLELGLWERHRVPVVRRTLGELGAAAAAGGARVAPGGALVIDAGEPGLEVSVVYFRAGYTPNDYDDGGVAWRARLTIETSAAVKCPSARYQLVGAKKARARARPRASRRSPDPRPRG